MNEKRKRNYRRESSEQNKIKQIDTGKGGVGGQTTEKKKKKNVKFPLTKKTLRVRNNDEQMRIQTGECQKTKATDVLTFF